MPNYECQKHHHVTSRHLYKTSCEIIQSMEDFFTKCGKSEKKMHKLCLFMFINPS